MLACRKLTANQGLILAQLIISANKLQFCDCCTKKKAAVREGEEEGTAHAEAARAHSRRCKFILFVTSTLGYCKTLYVGLPSKTLQTFPLVHSAADKVLTGISRHKHMAPVLKQHHWLSCFFKLKSKWAINFKVLKSLGPEYLKGLLLLLI